MYIAVSIINKTLGKVILCKTFEEAVEAAIGIANSWPPIVSNFVISRVRTQLESIHEYHACDPDDGKSYSICIGVINEI